MNSLLRPGGRLSLAALAILVLILMARGVTEEVRTGHLTGRVVMAENGRPLPNATVVIDSATGGPDDDRGVTRIAKTDKDGMFSVRHIPVGACTISAYTKVHSLDASSISIQQGQTTHVDLDLKPNVPYLDLYSSQRVYLPAEQAQFHCRGFASESEIKIGIYRIRAESIGKKGSISSLLEPYRYYYEKTPTLDGSPDFEPVHQLNWKIASRDGEGVFDEHISLPQLTPGIYMGQLDCGSARQFAWLTVTDIALVTKSAGNSVLAYVTKMDSGQPVQGAVVGWISEKGSLELGKTDEAGIARVVLPKDAGDGSRPVYAQAGDSLAISSFYSYSEESAKNTRTYIYTERPVYRPGDVVKFKGVIRRLAGDDYELPAKEPVEVRLQDPDGNRLASVSLALSDFCTFSGEFTLPDDLTGQYYLSCNYQGATSERYVPVMAYRKPEFKIDVKAEKPFYLRGQKVRFVANCDYYFGGPVPGAEFRATIYRRPIWQPFELGEDADLEEEEGGGYDYVGDYVGVVSGRTDAQGLAHIEFDPTLENFDTEYPQDGRKFDFGDSDYQFTCEVGVTETGDKYFSGKGSVSVVRGEFDLRADPTEYLAAIGEKTTTKISLKRFEGGHPVAQTPVLIEYGFENWSGANTSFVRLGTGAVTTDEKGEAEFQVNAERAGSFVVRASVRDTLGNTIQSQAYIYILSAGEPTFGGPSPKLDLTLDKKLYGLGDVVQGLIRAEKVGGTALVTIEGDEVFHAFAVPLKSPATSFSFKVAKRMTPNAYVSIAYVREKTFAEAQRLLKTDMGYRAIDVKIAADRAVVKPGEAVTYDIQTSDAAGNPISAECSLGVVDEAIYAIAEDTYDPIGFFYPRRYQGVTTSYSFPEHYLDGGDKGPVNGEVRQNFQDTAAWLPTVVTDGTGKASVTIKLPDNVTEWRATVRAVTKDTAFGKATAGVKARLPLMVRLSAPSHVVEGDTIRVSASVLQDVADSAEFRVSLQGASGQLRGNPSQVVRVMRGEPAIVKWDWVAANPGAAKLSVTAEGAGVRDAMALDIPVKTHGRPNVANAAGEVTGEERVQVVRFGNATDGRVRITVTPTLISALLDSLDGLIDYPYGCTEQTMSRFLPAVVTGQLIRKMGLQRPELMAKLPEVASRSMTRLRNLQHPDGSWGWWENDQTDTGMTALVLEGLWESQKAGYPPPGQMISRAKAGAQELLKRAAGTPEQITHLAYGLALWEPTEAHAEWLSSYTAPPANAVALAWYALACKAMAGKFPTLKPLGINAADRLKQIAERDSSTMHWKESYGVETTAIAMKSLSKMTPDDPDLVKIARYLMRAKRAGGWLSTRDTATVLLALAPRAERELASAYDLTVEMNGKSIGNVRVGPSSRGPWVHDIPISNLANGNNELVFRKSGAGVCYYAVETRQIPHQERIGVLLNQSQLSIQQSYHSLRVRTSEQGEMRLMPSPSPETTFRSGDVLKCIVKLQAKKDLEYVVIEIPIPAGFRVTEDMEPMEWNWWWSGMSILDDRVAVFAASIAPGQHHVEFTIRAEAPGETSAMPATAYEMYAPDQRASCEETRLRILP
ncbi:MAG: hypothetical protein HONBIEJF_02835 [Fimbriimonadaceae bacterium]|nr:hypothetical protein [Fimbriimonadaceae bacterium]